MVTGHKVHLMWYVIGVKQIDGRGNKNQLVSIDQKQHIAINKIIFAKGFGAMYHLSQIDKVSILS